MITICCMCKKVITQCGWTRQSASSEHKVSHGYCPDCYQNMMKKFKLDPQTSSFGRKRLMQCH